MVQAVDVPLTNEAFDGVFGAMAAISIAYTLTHVYGLISIILVSNVIKSMDQYSSFIFSKNANLSKCIILSTGSLSC